MLNKFKQTLDQWGGSNEVIDQWLDMRQTMLVEYCQLAALQPCSSVNTVAELPPAQDIYSFCQKLVNYISTGHFQIYDMVKAQWESTGFKATEEIDQTYFTIIKTTDPLLNFAEKYLDLKDDDSFEDFDEDLSAIGELLEYRFEVEDQLIQLIVESLSIPPGA